MTRFNQTAPEYSGPSRSNREDDCGQRRLREAGRTPERDPERLATVPSGSPRLVYRTASLLADVVASQSLATFKGRLKTFLF